MRKFEEVFLVDDDDIYAMVMKRFFEQAAFCHQYIYFSNGFEVKMELLKREQAGLKPPSLIIMDLNMPIEDGWNLVQAISEFAFLENTIVYLASSTSDPADVAKVSRMNRVERLLIKPINKEDLIAIKNKHTHILI